MKIIFTKRHFSLLVMLGIAILWALPVAIRSWWLFLVGSYATAFVVLALRDHNLKDILQTFFDKKIWLHKTMFNEAIFALCVYVLVFFVFNKLPDQDSQAVAQFFTPFFEFLGLRPSSVRPPFWVVGLYTISIALMYDFGYYLSHRLFHKNRFLWEIHKVHHSAQVMTPFTTTRLHPIEILFDRAFRTLFVGITSAFFLYLYPTDMMVITMGETNIVFFLFLFFGGSLAHSNIWISFGPLEKIFISPAMHHIHHSTAPHHFNKNFAFIFSFWDRLFGTVYYTGQDENIVVGLGEEENNKFLTFKDMMMSPIKRGIQASRPQ